MSDYIAQLALLTDEEQAIYRQDWIEPDDAARLKAIEAERRHLWSCERARRAGAAPPPPGDWKVDAPNGWTLMHERKKPNALSGARLPVASAQALMRDLVAYSEEASHAAD